MQISMMRYKSPFGPIYCVFEGEYLIELSFIKKPELAHAGCTEGMNKALAKEMDDYFAGTLTEFRQKIKFISGTPFEQKIWLELRKIPAGQTRSYKWMAGRAGNAKASRAAGQALGKNPIPLILPCHRIIASDGTLGGFSSGLKVKEWLLKHEKAIAGKR
jgi:methylated-DNA-[protein]-cysteine S-methyltransferase